MNSNMNFSSVEAAAAGLEGVGYLPSKHIAMAAFLADGLEKPVLVEGPAGVGKTAFARCLAEATGRTLIRLQCYEGLDESKALYEWEYAKQLLYTQLLKDKIGELMLGATTIAQAAERVAASDAIFFSRAFLLKRPVLQALLSETPALLLIDEIDKADPEFEAFLLEVLAENAVTIPELGTLKATHIPRVVLTSNAARELSDALKRRCLHLFIDFPTPEREVAIVRAQHPNLSQKLAQQLVEAVSRLRSLELKKWPSISETLDWAKCLTLLNADTLSHEFIAQTLNVVLKHESDLEKVRPLVHSLVAPIDP
jgi:MoxR-like ATPase